jgi:NosR/NirI family nitrous oxide reductase transcriptional regulator
VKKIKMLIKIGSRRHDSIPKPWETTKITRMRTIFVAAFMAGLGLLSSASAEDRLGKFLAEVKPAELVPGSDHLGPPEGRPALATAYAGSRAMGSVWLNSDWTDATGYSGKPINILIGMNPDGTLTGLKLVEHHEPIVLVGIAESKVRAFIDGYVGANVRDAGRLREKPPVDIVSGATVSMMVIGDSITRSQLKVAQKLAGAPSESATSEAPKVDPNAGAIEDWRALVGDGSVARLSLGVDAVNAAFERSGNAAAAARPEPKDDGGSFIDLYVAPVSVPAIGKSLLGEAEYGNLAARLKPGQQALLVAGAGRYSWKGSGYVRGGIFDRIALIQADATTRFHDRDYRRLGELAPPDAPQFDEIGLFIVPESQAFDPAQPWRLQLLVQRATGALEKAFVTFDAEYRLPEKYLVKRGSASPSAVSTAVSPEPAIWMSVWRARATEIATLGVALAILTGIFFFQTLLTKRPALFQRLRLGFLLFTLVWLGWWEHAQLSVVNVFAFTGSLMSGAFRWDSFLLDPLVFILWAAVAVGMLFWGRGSFCGWLCPFGALQEFIGLAATRLKLPKLTPPWGLHERLWPLKYILFLGLFGLSLYDLSLAERAAEVEPFKTAIVLHFVRAWPFVAFALAMLAPALLIERFYCRYLCPLGAALAVPGRMRMFDWLRRYKECGSPCGRCAFECPVNAIHPEGHINPNECIQCLHCQVLYYDDHLCPHMIQLRLKKERIAAQGPILAASLKSKPVLAQASPARASDTTKD